jgi:hypothetical protein
MGNLKTITAIRDFQTDINSRSSALTAMSLDPSLNAEKRHSSGMDCRAIKIVLLHRTSQASSHRAQILLHEAA